MPKKKSNAPLTPQRPADGFDADASNEKPAEQIAPSLEEMATAGGIDASPVDPRDAMPEVDDVSSPPPAFATMPMARARRAPATPPPANPAPPGTYIPGRDPMSRAGDAHVARFVAGGHTSANSFGVAENRRVEAHVRATIAPAVVDLVSRAFNGGRRQ